MRNCSREENAVDFHDLINRARRSLPAGSGRTLPAHPDRRVQDISNGRMNLAKALKRPGLPTSW